MAKREEILDEVGEKLPKSFFEQSYLEEDKFVLPSLMWQQAINKAPNRRHVESMQAVYPLWLIDVWVKK